MRPRRQGGLSLVELMVGMTLGLLVVGAGLSLVAGLTVGSRQLMLEARLSHELRAGLDLVLRDLRRAGQGTAPAHFYGAACNAAVLGASAPSPALPATHVCYALEDTVGEPPVDGERGRLHGFHLTQGVLYAVLNGSAAQAVTDPGSLVVTEFVVTPRPQSLSAAAACRTPCVDGCPRVVVREFDVLIGARASAEPSLRRRLSGSVRVRNDYRDGQCPL